MAKCLNVIVSMHEAKYIAVTTKRQFKLLFQRHHLQLFQTPSVVCSKKKRRRQMQCRGSEPSERLASAPISAHLSPKLRSHSRRSCNVASLLYKQDLHSASDKSHSKHARRKVQTTNAMQQLRALTEACARTSCSPLTSEHPLEQSPLLQRRRPHYS